MIVFLLITDEGWTYSSEWSTGVRRSLFYRLPASNVAVLTTHNPKMRVCSVVVFISRLVVPLKFDWDFSSNRSCFCCGFYFIPTDKISCQAADRPWRWFPWWQASPVDLALMAQLKLIQKRRILALPPLFVIRFGNLTNVSFYRCHQEFVTNSMQACNSIAHCIPVKGIKSRLISYFYSRFYPKIVKKKIAFLIS